MEKIKFIDLFAGIGGFHIAISELGGECVFASEINEYAIETYHNNYGMDSNHDITKINPKDLPDYNMLCAGFPCQTFSKAGGQKGFDDTRGTLFFDIKRLLEYRVNNNNPVKYIVLENVRNLVSHDDGNTWEVIRRNLKKLGYVLTEDPIIVSPHQIGIPQLRERVFILGIHNTFDINEINISIPKNKLSHKGVNNAFEILDKKRVPNKYYISDYENKVLTAWDEFIKGIDEKTIGFPIWSSEFKGSHQLEDLPSWKKKIVLKNRMLYQNNKEFIDQWFKKYDNLDGFVVTHRKFEWQAGNTINSLWDGIIQFRPSGIRVKRPTEFPVCS